MKNKTLKVTRDQLQKFSDSRRGSDDFGSHPDFPGFEFYSVPLFSINHKIITIETFRLTANNKFVLVIIKT